MKKTTLALLIISALYHSSAVAEQNEVEDVQNMDSLEEIVVSGDSFSQQMGTQKITSEQIEKLPGRNNNITDLLRSNPNVQFSSTSNSSTNPGEIRPDEVSFHGEKFYNNNFIIDGMSNNDNMDPGAGNNAKFNRGASAYGLPEGGTQSMWIDTSLIKQVEVLDSNVGAKYGNFTGGVVNAELKDPDFSRWNTGKVFYRTTRDSWAHFYIDEEKLDEFNRNTRVDQTPKFTKHIYGFNMSQKLTDKAAMIFGYTRTVSDIDFYHSIMKYVDEDGNTVGGSIREPQKRENETFLWKGMYIPDNGDIWRLTAIYSKHSANLVRANIMNGGYKTIGGGLQVNLDWEKQFDQLKMKSYVGFKQTGDTVDNDSDDYHSYRYSRRFNWRSNNVSPIGGYGLFKTQKTNFTVKQDFSVTEFDWLSMAHKLTFGWSVDYATVKYERETGSSNYTYQASNTVKCNGAEYCFDGEQFASSRLYYAPRKVKVGDTDLAVYLQDQITWKNLETVIGARLSRNQYTGNTSLSPRFSVSYDVFGDKNTRLFGGINRYYAASMLAYKLRQGIGENLRSRRTVDNQGNLSSWSEPTSGHGTVPTHYMDTKVKTPYSDEIVLGISQNVMNSNWTFKWVNRKSRDGLSYTTRNVNGRVYRTLTNRGSGENDSFTLVVQPNQKIKFKYAEFGWQLQARRSITKSNNQNYDSAIETTDRAIYNNRLLDVGEQPPSDFNSPWSVGFGLSTDFPSLNLYWHQDFNFIQGREYLDADESKVDCSLSSNRTMCGDYLGLATRYKDAKKGSEFAIDWRFVYKVPTLKDQSLEITLDINNVLNKRSLAVSADGTKIYKMGRNFWLGVSYNW